MVYCMQINYAETPHGKEIMMSAEKDNNAHSTLYEIIEVPETTKVMFRTSVDPGSYIPIHWHRAIEIIYLLDGELDVTVENETKRLFPGDCTLINPNIMHATKCTRPNTAILLQIPIEFAELYIPNIQQLLFILDPHPENPVRRTKLDMFKSTLSQMQVANDIRPDGFLLRFNSLLFELLFQLQHNFSVKVFQADNSQRTKDLERLNTILKYTAQNYKRPIPLEEIADVACLQIGYFCRFFKKNMGVTFLEYQNELRLSYIYRDLITTDKPVHDILEYHGFTNYKLFRRMFQEHFGDTPLHIRKKHGNE